MRITMSHKKLCPVHRSFIAMSGSCGPLRFEVHEYDGLRCLCNHGVSFAIPFHRPRT
jgi:hypothetical protein